MYKILIVEDDETIAGGLKNHLGKWNYQAECMTDFKDVMGKFVDFDPQLVLLGIVLPFFNGFHWCQEIRKVSKVPVLFISSANESMNIVMAMNMGGDEFIAFFHHYDSMEKLNNDINQLNEIRDQIVLLADDHSVNLAFSYGVCYGTESTDLQRMIEIADYKMYENKRKRKGR